MAASPQLPEWGHEGREVCFDRGRQWDARRVADALTRPVVASYIA